MFSLQDKFGLLYHQIWYLCRLLGVNHVDYLADWTSTWTLWLGNVSCLFRKTPATILSSHLEAITLSFLFFEHGKYVYHAKPFILILTHIPHSTDAADTDVIFGTPLLYEMIIQRLLGRRYPVLAAITLIVIWLWVALGRLHTYPTQLPLKDHSNRPPFEQAENVRDLFDFPAVDSESIKSICGDTQWNQSVVFTCDNSVGGVGNIRNSILNCVRYAISAGASLVLPRIVLRNVSDISEIRTGITTEMSYMFDTEHFLSSIRLSCPQLQIHLSRSDVKDISSSLASIPLLPESLVDHVPNTGLSKPKAWRGQFYAWLDLHFDNTTTTGPMIVDLQRSYLQYPIYSDGEGFALSFGSILKFRSDVRIIASKTLYSLVNTYSRTTNISQDILPNTFFGVHLRTEKDAVEGWPAADWKYSRFETQSRLYLEQASRSNASVIYVASGDLDEVSKFAHNASTSALNMTVTTKFDLLKDKDLEKLKNLKWDQQGLVDFLVMLKASDFAGIGHSSFAWNIALKRHTFSMRKDHLDGPQMLSDELSQIYGIVRGYPEYAACLWPWQKCRCLRDRDLVGIPPKAFVEKEEWKQIDVGGLGLAHMPKAATWLTSTLRTRGNIMIMYCT